MRRTLDMLSIGATVRADCIFQTFIFLCTSLRPLRSLRLCVEIFALTHLASSRWIFQRFPGDANHLVVAFLGTAQIDILDWVVRLRHLPLAAWTVDDRGLHRRDHR